MPITPSDLGGDEYTARRVLILARDIAPCLDSFPDGSEQQLDAIAVLLGVIAELPKKGSRRTRSMSRNGTSITLADIKSAFDDDARQSLQSLCSAGDSRPADTPVGSFPTESAVAGTWQEGEYT